MQCTNCNIWRPEDRFNTITTVDPRGKSITVHHYCLDDQWCRLESLMMIHQLKEKGYEIAQTHILTLEQEEDLLRRFLRVEYGLTCGHCHHDLYWHTTKTFKGLGCTRHLNNRTPCTCIHYIPKATIEARG